MATRAFMLIAALSTLGCASTLDVTVYRYEGDLLLDSSGQVARTYGLYLAAFSRALAAKLDLEADGNKNWPFGQQLIAAINQVLDLDSNSYANYLRAAIPTLSTQDYDSLQRILSTPQGTRLKDRDYTVLYEQRQFFTTGGVNNKIDAILNDDPGNHSSGDQSALLAALPDIIKKNEAEWYAALAFNPPRLRDIISLPNDLADVSAVHDVSAVRRVKVVDIFDDPVRVKKLLVETNDFSESLRALTLYVGQLAAKPQNENEKPWLDDLEADLTGFHERMLRIVSFQLKSGRSEGTEKTRITYDRLKSQLMTKLQEALQAGTDGGETADAMTASITKYQAALTALDRMAGYTISIRPLSQFLAVEPRVDDREDSGDGGAYRGREWRVLNVVHVAAGANASYVLMRDHLGNWQVKGTKNDPTELINAVYGASVAALEAVTNAGGVSQGTQSVLEEMAKRGRRGTISPLGMAVLLDELKKEKDEDVAKQDEMINNTKASDAEKRKAREEKVGILEDYRHMLEEMEAALEDQSQRDKTSDVQTKPPSSGAKESGGASNSESDTKPNKSAGTASGSGEGPAGGTPSEA